MRKMKWLLGIVLFLSLTILIPHASVKAGKSTFNGHSYKVINEGLTWSDANAACVKLGGHLATITSKEENEFVKSLIASDGPGRKNYWLGGHKNSKGTINWVTGEKVSFTSWAPRQPDYGYETALMMYTYDNPKVRGDESYLWNDIVEAGTFGSESWFGLDNFGYICEWDDYMSLYESDGHFHTYNNPSFKWKGEKCYVTFKCKCGEKLKLECDYYEKVKVKATTSKEGKVRLTPTIKLGDETYSASSIKTFKIKKIGKCTIDENELLYTGERLIPSVTVKNSDGEVIDPKYYTLKYYSKADLKKSESIEPGEYYVSIKFKNRYSGSKALYYTIVKPKDPAMDNIKHLCGVWGGKYFTTDGNPGLGNGDERTNNTLVASSAYFESLMGFRFSSANAAKNKFPKHFINGDYEDNRGYIYPTAYTCAGFANFAHWYIYSGGDTSVKVSSSLVARNVDNNYAALVNVVKPGDMVRYGLKDTNKDSNSRSKHSAIVISIDENKGIYVLDANYLRNTPSSQKKDYNLVGAHYIPFYNGKSNSYYQLTVTGVR